MGSLFRITLFAGNKTNADAAAVAAFERVEELNRIMSDYDPQSELMKLCGRPIGEAVVVSADLFHVLQASQKLSEQTDGAFDVTVGPFVQLWRNARKKKVLPTENEIAEAQKSVGRKKLRLDSRNRTATLLAPDMKIDLGGIAKGFAADEALMILKGRGITRAMVAASGDIALGDAPPGEHGWKIGVAAMDSKTDSPTQPLLLRNCGVSTSGDAEQFVEIGGKRFSHIVNPATGLGLTERIQVTVIAPNATQSDSLATAVCILGVKRGLALADSHPQTSALVTVSENGGQKTFASRHFEKKD